MSFSNQSTSSICDLVRLSGGGMTGDPDGLVQHFFCHVFWSSFHSEGVDKSKQHISSFSSSQSWSNSHNWPTVNGCIIIKATILRKIIKPRVHSILSVANYCKLSTYPVSRPKSRPVTVCQQPLADIMGFTSSPNPAAPHKIANKVVKLNFYQNYSTASQ